MPEVSDNVSVRGLGSTRVDVDISAESPDGEEALEWIEDIRDAVKTTTKAKKEDDNAESH